MGFIKSGLLVIVSTILFLLLFIGGIFLTFSLSLNYDSVHLEFISVTQDLVDEINLPEVIDEKLESMESHCQNNSEFIFSEEGNTFVIPCEVIPQGPEAIIESGVESVLKDNYYKDYDCDFWDCFEKTGSPSFLVSEKARVYWNMKFYLSLLIVVILVVLMFFLIEKKTSLPLLVGSLLIISSLPFMKLNSFVGILINPALAMAGFSNMPVNLFNIFSIFFSKAHTVFLIMFLIGVGVLIVGVILKLFKIGFKISEFFSKRKGKEKVSKTKETSKSSKDLKSKSK